MALRHKLRHTLLLTLSLLSACGAAEVQPFAAGAAEPSRVAITGAPGDYLAGRFAAAHGDDDFAAQLFNRALRRDPSNPDILQRGFLANLMAGRPEAVQLARRLPENLAADLLLGNAEVKDGRWNAAEQRYAAMVRQGVPQLLQPLLVAWVQHGGWNNTPALATLRPLVEGQRFRAAYALHAALIADLAGAGFEAEAARLYRIAQADRGGGLQLARAIASWETRQGHTVEAQAALNALVEQNPEMALVLPRLYAGIAERPVRSAKDGIAEAYLALAGALRGADTNDFAMVLVRLALDLRPESSEARLLAAEILDSTKKPEAALAMLKPVPDDDPLGALVRMRQASLMERTGDVPGALEVTAALAARYPGRPEPFTLRGDILRGQKRFAEAVVAYDRAVALLKPVRRSDWVLFYERGIALDRSQNWELAEADFQKALELSPDEPFVLNYLGYSWTEQGRNLTRARAMLESALKKRPNDGAIVDSLGWVALRQGHTAEAVSLLERATELEPSDATINAHLGDAYWAAKSRLLAQFQWRRALSFSPDAEDIPKIQAKLRESEQLLGNPPVAANP